MRTSVLMVAAAVTLARGVDAQSPWGNVKSWTGTVTIEAVDTRSVPGVSATMKYKATGAFTIADDMMPDGSHMQWPMPSVETMADPKLAASAYERWQAEIVATYEAKGVDEMGAPFSISCTADNKKGSTIGLTINPVAPTYIFQVTAPVAIFKCSGTTAAASPPRLRQVSFQLTGDRGAPGPVSGTKTFKDDTSTITVSYRMAPTKKN